MVAMNQIDTERNGDHRKGDQSTKCVNLVTGVRVRPVIMKPTMLTARERSTSCVPDPTGAYALAIQCLIAQLRA